MINLSPAPSVALSRSISLRPFLETLFRLQYFLPVRAV